MKQAPEIIARVLVNPVSLWVSIVLAFLTFSAVVVALFQEKIKRYWNRAVLDMEINLTPLDCNQIYLTDSDGHFGSLSLYLRIKVIHKKGSAGENVEIMPIGFEKIDENGRLELSREFLPINLVWSHFEPRTVMIRVPVNSFRYCDLGHLRKSNGGNFAFLFLDTMVQSNRMVEGIFTNVFWPGTYQIELKLTGDNVKALRKKWEIKFEQWSDDRSEMLNKNIKLREVSEIE